MRIDHGLLKQFLLLPETAMGHTGGEVSASGLFAAGQNPGDYPTALEVRIYKKNSMRTTSVSVTILS